MPVDFRTSTTVIPNGTVGRVTLTDSVTFGSPVQSAAVAINGFQVEYDTVARRMANLEMDTDIGTISGADVEYEVEVELADADGGESYHGFCSVVVIAET
jgi:hypothetical protein